MKTPKYYLTPIQEGVFSIIHFIGTLSLVVMISFLLGCIQKQPEKVDYGPEVSTTSVDVAIVEAFEGRNMASAQKGEWVLFETTYRISTGGNNDSGFYDLEVSEKLSDNTNEIYLFTIKKSEYDSGGNLKGRSQGDCASTFVGYNHNCHNYSPLAAMNDPASTKSLTASVSTMNNEFDRVTYHNLQIFSGEIEAPAAVKSQPNCLDLPNCRIPVKRIEYDVVGWKGENATRYHYERVFSKAVPFLGANVSTCVKYLLDVENRKYPVTSCQSLINFRRAN